MTNRVTFRVGLSDLLCHRVPLGCFWAIQLFLCRNPQRLVSIHVWNKAAASGGLDLLQQSQSFIP